MLFNTGDTVRITYDGQTLDGEIFLACSTALSITVTFNGRLGSYSGLMPLLWLEDRYIDLVSGKPVTISRRGRVLPWPAAPVHAETK
jgi:hypothetical protein